MLALAHQFGIIKEIESLWDIKYEPQEYKCVSVPETQIKKIFEPLKLTKTYWHNIDRPEFGLAYDGVTLLPPESLRLFQDIVLINCMKTGEVSELCLLIQEAIYGNKYMIHFGI